MHPNSPTWRSEYPHVLSHSHTTLHFQSPLADKTRCALQQLIEQAPSAKRVSAPLACSESGLFTKREQLDSLKKKWRVQRGNPRSKGLYDWTIEELINTREATRRGARVAGLVGFGYSRSKFGLVQDLYLITEFLDAHDDGLSKVRNDPSAVHRVIEAAFELLHDLHQRGISHMDLWAANVMLPRDDTRQPLAIDLENSFCVPTAFFSETLGFQLGFLYLREIYRYITEADFDACVDQALQRYFPAIDRPAFDRVYAIAKHEDIGRLERREIFLKGTVPNAG